MKIPRFFQLSRGRKALLILMLIGYTAFFMLGGCADKLILFPSHDPIHVTGADQRSIPFEGATLDVWTTRTPPARESGPEAYVLVFVGNADRAEHHITDTHTWNAKPVEIWAVNHPGYGASTAPAKLAVMPRAGLAVYDACAQQANGKPIFIHATSIGTTVALHVARHRPVAGLVLRTPVPLRQLILGRFGWWNLWLAAGPVALGVPADLSALDNAAAIKSPAIFLLADYDEVVPFAYQERVRDAYAGPRQTVLMNGSGHNDPLAPTAQKQLIQQVDWLWNAARP